MLIVSNNTEVPADLPARQDCWATFPFFHFTCWSLDKDPVILRCFGKKIGREGQGDERFILEKGVPRYTLLEVPVISPGGENRKGLVGLGPGWALNIFGGGEPEKLVGINNRLGENFSRKGGTIFFWENRGDWIVKLAGFLTGGGRNRGGFSHQ